jgi:hypothetical protein
MFLPRGNRDSKANPERITSIRDDAFAKDQDYQASAESKRLK